MAKYLEGGGLCINIGLETMTKKVHYGRRQVIRPRLIVNLVKTIEELLE
jgi:hypothetical protein